MIKQELSTYLQQHTHNGVLFFAQSELEKAGDDPEKKNGAVEQICELLSSMQQEFARNEYINQISKKYKLPKKDFTGAIKRKLEERVKKDSEDNELAKVPDKYRNDFEEYGFYEKGNCYMFGNGNEASNFVIHPLFHVKSKNNNLRIIRLINDKNDEAVVDVSSKGMVKLTQFEEIIYDEGDFLWYGSTLQYKRVLRKIGNNFPLANHINSLGWQRQGFFAFANGISTGDGFKPIDEYGIVEMEGLKYFLPAFSVIYRDAEEDDDDYENDRHFRYESGNEVNFREWALQMDKVFGDKGRMAVAYLMASLFRDHIFRLFKFFPHLFLFGQKGSGKSLMAWRLNNIFFHGQPGFSLPSGTPVGFYRKLARTSNAVVWFDEYGNEIDPKRIQALKQSYDGFGHEKGMATQDNRTKITKAKNGMVISGQYLPTADDNALFERSMLVNFPKRDTEANPFTREEMDNKRKLEHWEEKGMSHLVDEVIRYRKDIEERFSNTFAEIEEQLTAELDDNYTQRILQNYCAVLTTVKILEKPLNLPFVYEDFKKQCLQMITDQTSQISESEGLATFWQMIEYLLDSGYINDGVDFMIRKETAVNVLVTRSKTERVQYEKPQQLLYLRLGKIHPLYMQHHRSQHGSTGIARESLKHYLKTNRAFVGITDKVDFNNSRTSAYVFRYDMLPMSLERHGGKVETETPATDETPEKEGGLPW